MYFEGTCREIDRVVVSDPCLCEEVGGRYVRYGIEGFDWKVQGFVGDMQDNAGGRVVPGKRFVLVFHDPDHELELRQDGSVLVPRDASLRKHDVLSFTGCVGLGVNDRADEILTSGDSFDRDCCLNIIGAGIFGSVLEGSYDDAVKFLVINGCMGDFAGYSQEEVKNYLVEAFDVELELSFSLDEKVIRAMAQSLAEEKESKEREAREFGL